MWLHTFVLVVVGLFVCFSLHIKALREKNIYSSVSSPFVLLGIRLDVKPGILCITCKNSFWAGCVFVEYIFPRLLFSTHNVKEDLNRQKATLTLVLLWAVLRPSNDRLIQTNSSNTCRDGGVSPTIAGSELSGKKKTKNIWAKTKQLWWCYFGAADHAFGIIWSVIHFSCPLAPPPALISLVMARSWTLRHSHTPRGTMSLSFPVSLPLGELAPAAKAVGPFTRPSLFHALMPSIKISPCISSEDPPGRGKGASWEHVQGAAVWFIYMFSYLFTSVFTFSILVGMGRWCVCGGGWGSKRVNLRQTQAKGKIFKLC